MQSKTKLTALVVLTIMTALEWGIGGEISTRTVRPGIEYRHEQYPDPLSIHIVKMELGHKELAVVTSLANGTVFWSSDSKWTSQSGPQEVGPTDRRSQRRLF